MSVWLNHYANRMRLARELGIMALDQDGRWIDIPIPQFAEENAETLLRPPEVPVEWHELIEAVPPETSASPESNSAPVVTTGLSE